MTTWGPAGDGRGDSTLPLPVVDLPPGPGSGPVTAGVGRAGPDTVIRGRGYPPGVYHRPVGRARRHWARRLLRWVVVTAVVVILLAAVAFGGLMTVTPSAGNAEQLAQAQDLAHHVAYPGPPVPARFAESLVATEDHRFYSEPGIDLYAVARVGFEYTTGHGIQGGATLYQQLAKLLYTHGRSTAADEAEQIAMAVKLYMTYTRPQILQMYADVVYFGNNFYGLAAASCGYFGVPPSALSWPQAAMLAGLVQGPSLDDPLTHPAAARAREVHVVGRLVATGKLTQAQGAAALAVPLSALVAGAGQGCSG
jgi:membrane carboxypeptidase/penicillin-binding protein PbpC